MWPNVPPGGLVREGWVGSEWDVGCESESAKKLWDQRPCCGSCATFQKEATEAEPPFSAASREKQQPDHPPSFLPLAEQKWQARHC